MTFSELVEMVVSRNGDGHKEVYRLRDAGEISAEETELILLAANVQILDKRVSCLAEKVMDFAV